MKKEKKKKSSSLSQNVMVVIIIAAIILVAGYILFTKDRSPIEGTYDILPGIDGKYSREKVEVIEIFDFMCSHCYDLHKTGVVKELFEKYGERLEVRYVVLHFIEDRQAPYQSAILPILALEYATANGKGEEMLDAIFVAHHMDKKDITDISVLQELASSLDLGTSDFALRLSSYEGQVRENDELAFNTYKLQLVPMVIIGGNLSIPNPDYTTFENMDRIIGSILSGNWVI